MQDHKKPDYVIPSQEIGVIYYDQKSAVGIQFTDNEGKQVFVSLPGKLLQALGEQITEFVAKHPQVLELKPHDPRH